jgi:hypothetical protein
MMTSKFTFASLAVTAILSTPFLASSEEAAPQLQVRTAEGRSLYQVGERISLSLSFTGPENRRFETNMASYDQSGRMSYEEFHVAPASGWVDPLNIYLGSSSVYMGGGLTGFAPLSAMPTVVNLNLNEWVRFDQPGTYTIVVVSHRVSGVSTGRSGSLGTQSLGLTSNPIQLRIIPARKAWEEAKLSSILNELEENSKATGLEPDSLKDAIVDLRFLGTAAAARVMAQHLREDEPFLMYECALGLDGLPERLHPIALAAMDRLIDDPDFPVSSWFINTMSVLQLSDGDPAVQREERARFTDADWAVALQALPAKEGKARAVTVQTLSSSQPKQITPQQKTELGGVLAASLKELPAERQLIALQDNWDLLRSAGLLPILELLAKTPQKNPGSNESNGFTTRELKSVALERWFELDPEGAHEEALKQIGSPDPSLTADSLAFLPRERLPQFESLWADALMTTDDYQRESVFASLMARFGTGSEVGQVQEKANSKVGEWACAPQGAALAYLVEFDPVSARPLVERAVKERGKGKTACNRSVFRDISLYATDPILTDVALEALDDPDPEVTMDALIYLMSYGDKSVEQPVWHRYMEWSEKWRKNADFLESRESGSIENWDGVAVGQYLVRALIENQGWLATPSSISRVLELCVGGQVCTESERIADQSKAGPGPYPVSAFRSGRNEIYQVAQYHPTSLELLEEKIAQFPRGTRFSLISTSPQNRDQMQLEDQVQELFEKNGMTLLRVAAPSFF